MVNGHQVKALFNTGTMGDNLIYEKFVSKNRIATENLEVPVSLKIAVNGSSSTINNKVKLVIQIATESGKITEALVSSLEDYDIFLEIPFLTCHQAVIDCRKATIMFPKTGYVF
jgi:hypothetical protein